MQIAIRVIRCKVVSDFIHAILITKLTKIYVDIHHTNTGM